MLKIETLHQNLLLRESSFPVKRWCVAFSGGLDSTVLLQALVALKLPQPILAVHVHHGLSPNADSWQAHCEKVCDSLNIPIVVAPVKIHVGGKGIEDAARKARFSAFSQLLQVGDVLLLGQHLDDQAETLLLRLLRGSGPKGLSAMPRERSLGKASLLRPLLSVARSDLLAYAQFESLQWIEDESNQDESFDRNYLRRNILPVLQSRWPDTLQRLGSAAELSREADQQLELQSEERLSALEVRDEGIGSSLNWTEMSALSEVKRNCLLRTWLRGLDLSTPERVHLAEISKQLFNAKVIPSPKTTVEWGSVVLRVHAGRLYALARDLLWAPSDKEPVIAWEDLGTPIVLPGKDTLQWQLAAEPGVGLAKQWLKNSAVQVAWRQGGERCHLVGKAHSESLKKRLQVWRVPLWLRNRIPVIYIEGEIAAVAGYCVNKAFAVSKEEFGYRCIWQLPEREGKTII